MATGSEKPAYLETWFEKHYPGAKEEWVWVTEITETPERSRLAVAAPALVRALLKIEWGSMGDAHGDEAYCSGCETHRVGRHPSGHRNGHDRGCHVDHALTAAGFTDQASRDEAREAIKNAARLA